MRILMLTPYLPYPLLSGGQIRTYNLLKKLAKDHDITLFALIKHDSERKYIPELAKYCKQVRVFNRSAKPFTLKNIFTALISTYPFLVVRNHASQAIPAIRAELADRPYDLIHAETFYMMPHLPKTKVPIILVEQTIEYLGYLSFAQKAPWWLRLLLKTDIAKIIKWEHHYWQACQELIVMSQDDKRFIAQQVPAQKNISVVANGVDTDWFNAVARSLPPNPTVLSVGTFKWLPNVEAVQFLVNQVWPLIKAKIPQAKLNIVGNDPTREVLSYASPDQGITVTGRIDDIRDAFKQAHVLVAPVFSGKGTRYKILEAMASGTPVVASEIAVEGLGVTHGVQVLTSNSAEKMAELTIDVMTNPSLWTQLSEAGRAFVSAKFDWNQIAQDLDSVYQRLGKDS
ncbi:MAG: glycosyl transferase family 1 protein [Parcubacteria group bacterium GW2011_GWF2_44_8]|nr:MAG: glycosyl transferase family 1 protein [Parcubacteria group bacterium GW2011_GWF2_44_8]